MSVGTSISKMGRSILWGIDTVIGGAPAIQADMDDEFISPRAVSWMAMPAWARFYVAVVGFGSLGFMLIHGAASNSSIFDWHEKVAAAIFASAALVNWWFFFAVTPRGYR